MTILYLVPTRGRPDNAIRLARAFAATIALNDTRLLFCIDDDDEKGEEYNTRLLSLVDEPGMDFVLWIVAPRERLGGTLNRFAKHYAQEYDNIGFMGDDHIPTTLGWDIGFSVQLANRPRIVYGNDLVQGGALPTAVCMSSDIIQALGYMSPPVLTHMYIDNFWRDLGTAVGCLTYMPDVIIRHEHPITKRAEWDDTYTEAGGFMGSDGTAYEKFRLDGSMIDAIRRVKALVK